MRKTQEEALVVVGWFKGWASRGVNRDQKMQDVNDRQIQKAVERLLVTQATARFASVLLCASVGAFVVKS